MKPSRCRASARPGVRGPARRIRPVASSPPFTAADTGIPPSNRVGASSGPGKRVPGLWGPPWPRDPWALQSVLAARRELDQLDRGQLRGNLLTRDSAPNGPGTASMQSCCFGSRGRKPHMPQCPYVFGFARSRTGLDSESLRLGPPLPSRTDRTSRQRSVDANSRNQDGGPRQSEDGAGVPAP